MAVSVSLRHQRSSVTTHRPPPASRRSATGRTSSLADHRHGVRQTGRVLLAAHGHDRTATGKRATPSADARFQLLPQLAADDPLQLAHAPASGLHLEQRQRDLRVTAAGDGRLALARRRAARRSRSAGSRPRTGTPPSCRACRRVRPSDPRRSERRQPPRRSSSAHPQRGCLRRRHPSRQQRGPGRWLPDLVLLLGAFLTWPLRRGRRRRRQPPHLASICFRLTLLHPVIPSTWLCTGRLARCREGSGVTASVHRDPAAGRSRTPP